MPADPLSDTLGLMDARCVISGGFTAGGDWALRFPPPGMLKITAVVKGGMSVSLDGLPEWGGGAGGRGGGAGTPRARGGRGGGGAVRGAGGAASPEPRATSP
ncbi:hypothetical protein ACFV4J_34105, partial [Streptomyces mirabilis]